MGMTYSGGSNDWDEGPSVFHQETLKAAKSHRCTECKAIIEAGQHYERSSGIWDGRWSTYRKCQFCLAFESAFAGHFKGFANASAFGQMLSDSQHEMHRLYSVDHPGRWFSVARKYVAIKKNYYAQAQNGVVDKAGRSNTIKAGIFWYMRKDEMAVINSAKKERNESRPEETLG